MNTPQNIILHHSITPRDLSIAKTEGSIENNHKGRGFPLSSLGWHIGYHYMIFGDGTVKQYRKDNEVGAHCKEQSMNFKSLGICLIGDFDKEMPSTAQIDALRLLMGRKTKEYNIPTDRIVPHRHYALGATGKPYKSCYGNKLPDNWGRLILSNQEDTMNWEQANGILYSITGETNNPDAQDLADAANTGDQMKETAIITKAITIKYIPKGSKVAVDKADLIRKLTEVVNNSI